jgi:hypothetical protein
MEVQQQLIMMDLLFSNLNNLLVAALPLPLLDMLIKQFLTSAPLNMLI